MVDAIKIITLNTKRKKMYFLPLFPLFIMVGSNKKMVVFLAMFYEDIVVKVGYIMGGKYNVKEKEVTSYIVDNSTGEVTEIYLGDTIYIVTKEQKDYFDKTTEINKGKKYVMVCEGAYRILEKMDLTPSARDILDIMLSHIGWYPYSGYVVKTKNNRFDGLINSKELMALTNCKPSAFKVGISQLEENKIIAKEKRGRCQTFIVNPFIATHDSRVPKTIFEKFQDSAFNYTKERLSQNDSMELKRYLKKIRAIKRQEEKR